MSIGLETYRNGTKDTWRGWQWNQIVNHLPEFKARPKPAIDSSFVRSVVRNKVVVYLAGPDDADRTWAIKRGFRNENLIAIDRERSCVEAVRNSGHLAIHGDAEEIVRKWPDDWPIDVLLLDFNGDISRSTKSVMQVLFQSPLLHSSSVVAINLRRGGQSSLGGKIRSELEATGVHSCENAKNRGYQASVMMMHGLMEAFTISGKSLEVALINYALLEPAIYSYRSGAAYFDSVVMSWPLTVTREYKRINDAVVRRIAAAKAHHTRRLEAGSRNMRYVYSQAERRMVVAACKDKIANDWGRWIKRKNPGSSHEDLPGPAVTRATSASG